MLYNLTEVIILYNAKIHVSVNPLTSVWPKCAFNLLDDKLSYVLNSGDALPLSPAYIIVEPILPGWGAIFDKLYVSSLGYGLILSYKSVSSGGGGSTPPDEGTDTGGGGTTPPNTTPSTYPAWPSSFGSYGASDYRSSAVTGFAYSPTAFIDGRIVVRKSNMMSDDVYMEKSELADLYPSSGSYTFFNQGDTPIDLEGEVFLPTTGAFHNKASGNITHYIVAGDSNDANNPGKVIATANFGGAYFTNRDSLSVVISSYMHENNPDENVNSYYAYLVDLKTKQILDRKLLMTLDAANDIAPLGYTRENLVANVPIYGEFFDETNIMVYFKDRFNNSTSGYYSNTNFLPKLVKIVGNTLEISTYSASLRFKGLLSRIGDNHLSNREVVNLNGTIYAIPKGMNTLVSFDKSGTINYADLSHTMSTADGRESFFIDNAIPFPSFSHVNLGSGEIYSELLRLNSTNPAIGERVVVTYYPDNLDDPHTEAYFEQTVLAHTAYAVMYNYFLTNPIKVATNVSSKEIAGEDYFIVDYVSQSNNLRRITVNKTTGVLAESAYTDGNAVSPSGEVKPQYLPGYFIGSDNKLCLMYYYTLPDGVTFSSRYLRASDTQSLTTTAQSTLASSVIDILNTDMKAFGFGPDFRRAMLPGYPFTKIGGSLYHFLDTSGNLKSVGFNRNQVAFPFAPNVDFSNPYFVTPAEMGLPATYSTVDDIINGYYFVKGNKVAVVNKEGTGYEEVTIPVGYTPINTSYSSLVQERSNGFGFNASAQTVEYFEASIFTVVNTTTRNVQFFDGATRQFKDLGVIAPSNEHYSFTLPSKDAPMYIKEGSGLRFYPSVNIAPVTRNTGGYLVRDTPNNDIYVLGCDYSNQIVSAFKFKRGQSNFSLNTMEANQEPIGYTYITDTEGNSGIIRHKDEPKVTVLKSGGRNGFYTLHLPTLTITKRDNLSNEAFGLDASVLATDILALGGSTRAAAGQAVDKDGTVFGIDAYGMYFFNPDRDNYPIYIKSQADYTYNMFSSSPFMNRVVKLKSSIANLLLQATLPGQEFSYSGGNSPVIMTRENSVLVYLKDFNGDYALVELTLDANGISYND